MFGVSVSPAPATPGEDLRLVEEGQAVELFRTVVRRPMTQILPKPPARRARRRVTTSSSPWRALGRKPGAGVKRQQQVLIRCLGLAREGERIGDEALQAYLRLFEQPLSSEHLGAIMALFGWEFQALPLEEGEGVVAASG